MRHGWTVAPAGFLLVLAVLGAGPDAPTNPVTVLDERFGVRTAPILLLARPDVQLDLRLEPERIGQAKAAIAQLVEDLLALKDHPGPTRLARQKAIDEKMTRWLVDHLSDAQLRRLRQIELQWEGALAMSRPVVAESLGLSDQQRREVDRLQAAQLQAWRARGRLEPADRQHFSSRALSILTRDQKELWDQLLGPACRFSIPRQAGASGEPADRPAAARPAAVSR
jgi:hypothetical protein